jgi:hypothetical protein
LEIFLVGPELDAHVRIVRDHLQHQTWRADGGKELQASRLVMPSAPHYDSVVAFLCAELVENGYVGDAQGAFSLTEPSIALALRRAQIGNEVIVGLAGELYFLESLCAAVPPENAGTLLSSWAGSAPSARDLQLGPVGVEVKTTTGLSSTHHVQGLHQVEPGGAVGGAHETHLYLLSIGITWLSGEESGGYSIPALVDSIAARLDVEAREDFIARVQQYGGDVALGYNHDRDRDLPLYAGRFTPRFERLYDMLDPRISIPRSPDLDAFADLDVASVSFRVRLRDRVRGEINPTSGMRAVVKQLLTALG